MRGDVYEALSASGIPVAHMAWRKGSAPELPYAIYYEGDSYDLMADGGNYARVRRYWVELYQLNPSEETEAALESAITAVYGGYSRQDEIWIEDEGMAMTVYSFTEIESRQ